jgi:hypothetical protein
MAATVEQLEKRVKTLEESLADSVAENKQLQSKLTSRTAEDIKAAGDEYDAITDSLVNLPSFAKEFGSAVVGSITDLSRGIGILEQQGTLIQQSFGVSRDRIEEFKTLIADVGPVLASIGISENEFASTITNITDKLGTAASLGAEAVTEIAAASKVSGVEVGKLAENFRGVGISMYDVGDRMAEVANYARSVGVPVKAVSEGVSTNLGKINLYNFEGGVQGLTRMATQAARLGVDMTKVFSIADELFSPEKAIDYAASLQRLGVTANGLLDPLKAMDMAQNDPEALQNEIVNLTKDFVKFSEANNKFEIMPGAQRRMREVAQALNIDAGEFAKMGIQAAEFDRKLSQIKLPSFADDKETKELIASMSQIKDGVATVTIKNIQTGKVELKQPDQLTPEDIEKLKQSQDDNNKSIEELAVEQLTQSQFQTAHLEAIRLGGQLGMASMGPVQRLLETSRETTRAATRAATTEYTAPVVRETLTPAARVAEDAVISLLQNNAKGFESAVGRMGGAVDNITTNIDKLAKNVTSNFQSAMGGVGKQYEPVIQKLESKNDINVNMSLDVKGGQNVQVSDTELSKKILELMENNPVIRQTIKEAAGSSQLSMNPNKSQ